LEDQVNFIKQYPDVVAVAGHIKCFSNSTEFSEEHLRSGEITHNSLVTREDIKSKRFWACPICSGTVLFSRKAAMEVGGYRLKFKIAYDYDLWMRLWQIGDIDILPQIIYHYRINSGSLSHSNWKETVNELQWISTSAIRRLHIKEGIIKPTYAVIGREKSCRNFEENIRKRNELSVYKYIDSLEEEQMREAKNLFRKNKVNGVIVLYNCKTP
jgi:hypothetical protein